MEIKIDEFVKIKMVVFPEMYEGLSDVDRLKDIENTIGPMDNFKEGRKIQSSLIGWMSKERLIDNYIGNKDEVIYSRISGDLDEGNDVLFDKNYIELSDGSTVLDLHHWVYARIGVDHDRIEIGIKEKSLYEFNNEGDHVGIMYEGEVYSDVFLETNTELYFFFVVLGDFEEQFDKYMKDGGILKVTDFKGK